MYKITRLLFVSLFILPVLTATAQVKIGDNSTQIHPKALLELESSNQMLLLPRLTNEQRDQALPVAETPAGSVIFNTTSGMLEVLNLEGASVGKNAVKTWVAMDISHTDIGSSVPENPKPGDTFYHTTTNRLMVYTGESMWYEVQTYPHSDTESATGQTLTWNPDTGVLELGNSNINLNEWFNERSSQIDFGVGTDNQELSYDDITNSLTIDSGNSVDLTDLEDIFTFTGRPVSI